MDSPFKRQIKYSFPHKKKQNKRKKKKTFWNPDKICILTRVLFGVCWTAWVFFLATKKNYPHRYFCIILHLVIWNREFFLAPIVLVLKRLGWDLSSTFPWYLNVEEGARSSKTFLQSPEMFPFHEQFALMQKSTHCSTTFFLIFSDLYLMQKDQCPFLHSKTETS